MARKPLLNRLLIWTWISTAFAHNITLGDDIRKAVPPCAQTLLGNFIRDSFPSRKCATDVSLSCLCSATSASGFTVGEGAVQCILAGRESGICSDNDADNERLSTAIGMCNAQPSASPITHSTLTVSFFVPPTGGAISLILPTQTTRPPPSTFSTVTSSTTKAASPTTIRTPSNPAPTSTTTDGSSSPTGEPDTEPPVTLQRSQIIGIAVGGASLVIVALAAILIARHRRRKRFPGIDENEFYQIDEHGASPDPTSSRLSRIFHISSPILRTSRYRPEPRPPLPSMTPMEQAAYQIPPLPLPQKTTNVDRDTIGLAISRPRSEIKNKASNGSPQVHRQAVPVRRRSSKLLPAKPNLTLTIPPQAAVATRVPSSQPPFTTTDRASTMTNMTAFADLDMEAAEGQHVWRPPPTDPQSATTMYVADKWGNWVLSNKNRQSAIARVAAESELDTYTPLTKSPLERQEEQARRMAAMPEPPRPAFLSQDPANPEVSRSSSLYSQASQVRQGARAGSANRSRSNSWSKSRKGSGSSADGGSGARFDRSNSQTSATTIQTNSSGRLDEDEDEYNAFESDIARLSHLSPVVESPSPLSGRSPVSYPKIPGRLDGATMRYVPPPKRPNFMGSPAGQPSPTLGVVFPVRDSPGAYPAPLNPKRAERAQQQRRPPVQSSGSGFSPETRNIGVFPVRSPPPPRPQRPDRIQTPPTNSFAPTISPPNTTESAYLPKLNTDSGPSATHRYQTPLLQSLELGFTPSPPTVESSRVGPPTPPSQPPQPRLPRLDTRMAQQPGAQPSSLGIASRPHISSQAMSSPMSMDTRSSAASSLLAKRLGSDRAAALALDANGRKMVHGNLWRRQAGDGVSFLSPDMAAVASPKGSLPMTPIWQPKLTPTRRGDDLFLNVQ